MCDYDEPLYLISVVAKILEVHPQTLRQYEKEGLVEPNRTDGKMRLYSQRDIDKIKTILRLTRDLGVNLAGVDIILRLKEELDRLNNELQNAHTKRPKENTNLVKDSSMPLNTYELILFKK
ncbi:heat shock protein transcriptional repressor HspR [Helicobacter cetorum]|uniref:Transcriptional regulator, MerR family protein n=1 Tax=Helicobacter cetorum (strain ATCC BAA-429 / MIT 00-7128) TaxID=182217 RepID=I0EM39_HELC0|nr:helix-turn-helix transcriptional regulator [Helicobacter cetorum]AFI04008.1 transcriptional regulator, MerR family protein [Helicobacter cetorum MIT 00-7128]